MAISDREAANIKEALILIEDARCKLPRNSGARLALETIAKRLAEDIEPVDHVYVPGRYSVNCGYKASLHARPCDREEAEHREFSLQRALERRLSVVRG